MEIGDVMAGLPRRCGGQRGGREQQTGEGVMRADRVRGPGSALVGCPGRVYEVVRHAVGLHAEQVQAVAGAGCCPVTPNQPPQTSHCQLPPVVAGTGADAAGGQVAGSHCHLPHSGQASSAIGRCKIKTGCRS